MNTVTVTFFENASAQTKRESQISLIALAELIRTTTAPRKDLLPWLKLARFGNRMTEKGSLRNDGNVIAITGVELDYDGECVSFDSAVDTAGKVGLNCIIYTSPSHTIERPRWRILCPTSRELLPDQRFVMVSRINGLYRGIFGRESWTLSQAYYYGSIEGRDGRSVELLLGCKAVDELEGLDQIAIGPPGSKSNAAGGSQKGPADAEGLIQQIISGESYHPASMSLLGLSTRR